MPSKEIIIVIELMFLGRNKFLALLRAHFNPRLMARAKMSPSRAQSKFMPANINSIVLILSCCTNKLLGVLKNTFLSNHKMSDLCIETVITGT